jgi:hypothetical protein
MTSTGDRSILKIRWPAVVLVAGFAVAGSTIARADCNSDFAALMTKRMTEINALNKISKAGGGKLDPVAACPRLRSLAAAEGQVVGYMTKNKEWCNLPDDMVSKMSATQAKTQTYAAKACGLVAKIKQMQAQQQKQAQSQMQEQAVKLPAGPL